jgi:DNA-binding response OmpR family regulator
MGLRILVVEDEPHMAKLLRQGLTEEDHAVTLASDGRDALSLAESNGFDLILLDVMLPGLDGWSVVQRLRGLGDRTPILMLTAKDTSADVIKGLNLGADDYLIKPFSLDILFARVRAMGRRGPAPRPLTLQLADLTLHQGTREVQRGNRKILLTRTEYSILELLLRESPRVVTYDALLQTVWGGAADVEINTIAAFMRLLRSKIESTDSKRLLHTIRGIGYVLRLEE